MATFIPQVGALVAGRYRIRGVASEGPGYLTLHAFDREVEVEVSLLWFRPGLFFDQRSRQAFVGDAVRTRGLAHPHLRRLYDAHIEGDSAFVAAQVGNAAGIIKRLDSSRPTDELDIIRYASAIGQGLEAAHRLGTVHGYLVPTDVIEVAGQIKVSGVGLFAAASADVARDLFWTRRKYIAPEVLRGELPTPTSDVFSMAVLLTELASGVSSPELSESAEALASQHIRLADIFARASRADPADRTQTVGALLAEVRRALVDDRVPTSERPAVGPPAEIADLLADYDSAPTLVNARPDSEDEGTLVNRPRPDSEDGETITRHRSELLEHPMSLIDASGDPLGDSPIPGVIPGDGDKTTEYRPVSPSELDDDDDDDLEPELIVVETPPPEAYGGTVEAALDPSPKTIQGVAPARRSSQAPTDPLESEPRPQFVSRKPPDEPGTPRTPHMPVIDRPDGQVKVRSIPSRAPSVAPQQLGNYAPPRAESSPPRPPEKKRGLLFFLWTFAGMLAIVLGGLIAVVVVRGDHRAPRAAAADAGAPPVDAAIVIIDAAPPKPCPDDMALVTEGEARFCIDLYEAPGRGKTPATEIGRAEAEARCSSRGARLCTSDEWEAGCRGADDAAYPYGPRYEKGRCNGGRGIRAEIAAAGSFPECASASGAFDMSGNVAEWTTEGFVQGGSARDKSSGRCSRRYKGSRQEEGYPDVGYRCCAEPDPDALAPTESTR